MTNKTYCYKYPRPSITTDMVVIAKEEENNNLFILLIERGNDPYKGSWALPGGFLEMNETLEEGALRELKEETSLNLQQCEEIGSFSTINRDPRGRTISVAFLAGVKERQKVKSGDDSKNCKWFKLDEIPPLAFDHIKIIEKGLVLYKRKEYKL